MIIDTNLLRKEIELSIKTKYEIAEKEYKNDTAGAKMIIANKEKELKVLLDKFESISRRYDIFSTNKIIIE